MLGGIALRIRETEAALATMHHIWTEKLNHWVQAEVLANEIRELTGTEVW